MKCNVKSVILALAIAVLILPACNASPAQMVANLPTPSGPQYIAGDNLGDLSGVEIVGLNPTQMDLGLNEPVQYAGIVPPADGQVIALGLLDTMSYLIKVLQADPSTFVMKGPMGEYLMAWAMQGNTWGFLAVDQAGAPLTSISKFTGSNVANTYTFSDLITTLEQDGWKYTFPTMLPKWLSDCLGSATAFVMKWGGIIATRVPMILVVPGGKFVNPLGTVQD